MLRMLGPPASHEESARGRYPSSKVGRKRADPHLCMSFDREPANVDPGK